MAWTGFSWGGAEVLRCSEALRCSQRGSSSRSAPAWWFRRPRRSASDDPFFDRQWALQQIGAPQAWQVTRGAGIVVGMVDTGVEASHPDLAGKVALTADCVCRPVCADGAASSDPSATGPWWSASIAAGTGNGRGVAAVAPDTAGRRGPGAGDERRGPGRGRQPGHPLGRGPRGQGGQPQPGRPELHAQQPPGDAASGGHRLRLEQGGRARAGVRELRVRAGSGARTTATSTPSSWARPTAPVAVAGYSSPIGNAKWGIVAPGGAGDSRPGQQRHLDGRPEAATPPRRGPRWRRPTCRHPSPCCCRRA